MSQKITILLIALFLSSSLIAQTPAQCDSILKKGDDAYNVRDYAKAMELYTKAQAIAEKKQWQKQLFWAKNGIGVTYYTIFDYGEAINYLLESYTIAIKYLEPKHEMTVLNNISLLYTKEKNYEKAREFISKAYQIANNNNDKISMAVFAINLANNANMRNKPAEAKSHTASALKYLKNKGLISLANMLNAESDLLEGKTMLARQKAIELYKNVPDLKYNDIGISLMMIISKSYLQENNLNPALESVKKILTMDPDLETKRTVYELLVDIYTKKGQYRLIPQYKDSILKTEKDLNDLKNGRAYENNKVKFEIQTYKKEIAANEEKLEGERKFFYAILIIVISILVIIGLIFRNRFVKYKQQKIIAEINQRIITLELQKEKDNNLILEKHISEKEAKASLEEERLKNEIESRNRELSSKELYISGRNQLIEDIISSLSENPSLTNNFEILNHIRSLKSHLEANNDWENFVTHFEQVNNGLLKRLQALHPSLTANDIRFIAYVYMNMTVKEIAAILNITTIACGKRKERIVAKLELPKNVSLYSYISRF